MNSYRNKTFTGERALYRMRDLSVSDSVFEDGESPLKEGKNLILNNVTFKWKYPIWNCVDVKVYNSKWEETARSGVWNTKNLLIKDSLIEAPKQFRRCDKITLENVKMPNALETMWTCNDITLKDVYVNGDYFGMNSTNVMAFNFKVDGNYIFDGGKNIEIDNAYLNSKDSFWNCENVVIKNSTIIGEYIGWHSKNLTFINCKIESDQGFCYIENLKIKDCIITNTPLAFEYSTVDINVSTKLESVKNPISGIIRCKGIDELIIDENIVDPNKIKIEVE